MKDCSTLELVSKMLCLWSCTLFSDVRYFPYYRAIFYVRFHDYANSSVLALQIYS